MEEGFLCHCLNAPPRAATGCFLWSGCYTVVHTPYFFLLLLSFEWGLPPPVVFGAFPCLRGARAQTASLQSLGTLCYQSKMGSLCHHGPICHTSNKKWELFVTKIHPSFFVPPMQTTLPLHNGFDISIVSCTLKYLPMLNPLGPTST